MRALKAKIMEALVSTLPVTVIVYILSLTPVFNFSTVELITFTVGAVLLAFGISAGIGIMFGYLPARKAAKLNPIDALRYD